ncbi:sugar phosphate nucleotidyltransferase [Jiangella muralis]|uniref:sugar phosphate nucleotidyltransferase n=1 Tax=Jiangella muralis TaxID=702383 RepID=UPI00069CD95C|nr:sugar phosphate nucleotidyltransferase [Jiangella muralis]
MNRYETKLADVVASAEASLRDCLVVIEKHGVETVHVVDERDRLVGVLDATAIHQALIAGAGMADPAREHVHPPVATVPPDHSRAHVLDVMRALRIAELPVVDASGRVVGVHAGQRVIGGDRRDNWAVLMAGGRGTRLAPLTDTVPKPMLPVAGRPILERLVLHLVGMGIDQIFISVNHLRDVIEAHFGDGARFGCSITYLREEPNQPLGTGGPLGLLRSHAPAAPVLVMNGDLVTEFAVGDLLDTHAEAGVVATVATSAHQHQVPFGVLEADRGRRLRRIVEKPTVSWSVNAGIYVIEPRLLDRIPPGELFPITSLLDDCLHRGEPVGLWRLHEGWQDIGRPEELARARGDR